MKHTRTALTIFITFIASHGNAMAENNWKTSVGLGAVARPTYEGSDEYTVTPLPYINANYKDMLQIGPQGVSAYWRQDAIKLGGGLVYNGGREDEDGGIFTSGDDRLSGMGDINGAIGAKAFAEYTTGRYTLGASATKYMGSDNDGILVEAGASAAYKASEKLMLTPHAGITWANEDYMQTWFGVTPTQSANSGFAVYNAGSGIKHADLGVRADYMLDSNWFISTDATVKVLTGDAGDSPIVESDTNGTLMSFVGYRF